MDQLQNLPKELRGQQDTIRSLLASPETRRILAQLQKADRAQLQAAAQAALQGDPGGLDRVLRTLSADPRTAQAVETLSRQLDR